MSDRRSRETSGHETPPLFDGVDDAIKESEGEVAAGDAGRLNRLVTKVAPRPKQWSMKWRPSDGEDEGLADSDRHPARSAGLAEEADVEKPSVVPLVLAEDSIATMAATPVPSAEETEREDSDPPVVTSRTWGASPDASGRHPATPSPLAAKTDVAAAIHATRPDRRPRSGIGWVGLAGWILACSMATAWWMANDEGEVNRPIDPVETPVLARPAVDPFEADLAREEISSLRQERERLMREVEAAAILLEDHRRLAVELRESTAANTGAAVELGVLEDDARRWQRRHDVAVTRMDELSHLLMEAEARAEALADELIDTQQRLEASRALDGSIRPD